VLAFPRILNRPPPKCGVLGNAHRLTLLHPINLHCSPPPILPPGLGCPSVIPQRPNSLRLLPLCRSSFLLAWPPLLCAVYCACTSCPKRNTDCLDLSSAVLLLRFVSISPPYPISRPHDSYWNKHHSCDRNLVPTHQTLSRSIFFVVAQLASTIS